MSGLSLFRRGALVVVAVLVGAGLASPASAAPGPFLIDNGVSQPIYSYEHAIRETVWVNTGTDLDADGYPDRVAVDIIRPAEPAARGQRIPVIMEESPYYSCCGRGNENQKKTYAPDGTPTGFPLFYDNYFVPRGYAVALVDSPGTNRSTGCLYQRSDVDAGVAVINWLNGKGAGYRDPFGSDRVDADWSTGAVGMIGKSNDATIAMGVAVTGVPGLRTIVPIAGDGNLYDFFSPGGANTLIGATGPTGPGLDNPRAAKLCAPLEAKEAQWQLSGDFTPYWQQFDYNRAASQIRASVFSVQGFNDENVSPLQFGKWWQALARYDVPRKAWLSQAGHADPFDLRRADWVDTLHRWFDHALLGVPNGIDHEPMISIEHAPDQWTTETNWPPAGVRDQTLRPAAGPVAGLGTLGLAGQGSESFTDSPDPNSDHFHWVTNPDQSSPERVLFETAPLTRDVRLAGTSSLAVTVRSSQPVATISAELVDYGPATVRHTGGPEDATGIVTLGTKSCWGESSATDSACYFDTAADLVSVPQQIISLGWADVGHYASPYHQVPLDPSRYYTRTVELSTMDHIVPAGHRLGLVIAGTDNWVFSSPGDSPALTVDLAGTSVTLPVAAN